MTLKDLLDVAKTQLQDLSTLPNPDFRLEQVEYKKDESIWDIVVSYLVENINKRSNNVASLVGHSGYSEFQYHRIYKRLTVNKDKEIEGFYIYNKQE